MFRFDFARRFGVVLALVGALALPAHAVTCRTGKPCGNSCISVSDTCHIGAGGGDEPNYEAIGIAMGLSGALLLGLLIWYAVPSSSGYGLDVSISGDGATAAVTIPF